MKVMAAMFLVGKTIRPCRFPKLHRLTSVFSNETIYLQLVPAKVRRAVSERRLSDLLNGTNEPLPEVLPEAALHLIRGLWCLDPAQRPGYAEVSKALDAIEGVNAGRAVDAAARGAVAGLRSRVDETVAAGAGPLAMAAGHLEPDAVFANAAVIMFGAIETSEGTTANALAHLLADPDQLDEVRADLDGHKQTVAALRAEHDADVAYKTELEQTLAETQAAGREIEAEAHRLTRELHEERLEIGRLHGELRSRWKNLKRAFGLHKYEA